MERVFKNAELVKTVDGSKKGLIYSTSTSKDGIHLACLKYRETSKEGIETEKYQWFKESELEKA